MLKHLVVRSRGHEDVRKRGFGLHQSQLRMAWEGIQDETPSDSAVYVDTLACNLTSAIAATNRAAIDPRIWRIGHSRLGHNQTLDPHAASSGAESLCDSGALDPPPL